MKIENDVKKNVYNVIKKKLQRKVLQKIKIKLT